MSPVQLDDDTSIGGLSDLQGQQLTVLGRQVSISINGAPEYNQDTEQVGGGAAQGLWGSASVLSTKAQGLSHGMWHSWCWFHTKIQPNRLVAQNSNCLCMGSSRRKCSACMGLCHGPLKPPLLPSAVSSCLRDSLDKARMHWTDPGHASAPTPARPGASPHPDVAVPQSLAAAVEAQLSRLQMVHMHATWYTLTDRSKPTAMLPPVEANNQATTFQAITYRIRRNCMEGTSVCCNPPNTLCCACSWCAYHSQLAMAQISTAFDFEMTAGAADTPTLRGGGASRPGEMTLPVRRRTTMLNMGSESRRTTAPGFLGSSSGGGVFGEAGDIGSLSGADLLPAAAATMPLPRRMSFLGPPGEPPAALDRWGWGTRVTPGEGSHPLLYFIDSVAAAHHNLMCDGCGGAPAGVPCC